jgi:hypothetical protein
LQCAIILYISKNNNGLADAGPADCAGRLRRIQMATRLAPAPSLSGLWGEALRQTGLKVIAYVRILAEAFVEAKVEARAAQARYGFISE